jgi:hypothetical protein
MTGLARLAEPNDPIIVATAHRLVDLADKASVHAATEWWIELTFRGGEGMVVKPRSSIARGRKGMMQPAVKRRGPEYLRISMAPNTTRRRSPGSHRRTSQWSTTLVQGLD